MIEGQKNNIRKKKKKKIRLVKGLEVDTANFGKKCFQQGPRTILYNMKQCMAWHLAFKTFPFCLFFSL